MHALTEVDEFTTPVNVPDGGDSRANAAEVIQGLAQALANRTQHLKSRGGNLNALLSWERRGDVGAYTDSLNGIAFGFQSSARKWVAVGSGKIFYSADHGKSWESAATPADYLRAVAYGNGKWVAVGSPSASITSGAVIYTSSDGRTGWTAQTPGGTPAGALLAVTYAAGTWVAVGAHGEIQSSPDAITWTRHAGATTENINSLVHDGTNFIAVGNSTLLGGTSYTSPDGATWSYHSIPSTCRSLVGVTLYQGGLAAVGYKTGASPNVGVLLTSSDGGLTWTQVQELGLFSPSACASVSKLIVITTFDTTEPAFGDHSPILVGAPGETFAGVPAPAGQEAAPGGTAGGSINAIATDGQKCCIAGTYGTLADSLITA